MPGLVTDVNEDGQVNAADVTALQHKLVTNQGGPEYDYNRDGTFDAADIQRYGLQVSELSGQDVRETLNSSGPGGVSPALLAGGVLVLAALAYGGGL